MKLARFINRGNVDRKPRKRSKPAATFNIHQARIYAAIASGEFDVSQLSKQAVSFAKDFTKGLEESRERNQGRLFRGIMPDKDTPTRYRFGRLS